LDTLRIRVVTAKLERHLLERILRQQLRYPNAVTAVEHRPFHVLKAKMHDSPELRSLQVATEYVPNHHLFFSFKKAISVSNVTAVNSFVTSGIRV